MYLTLSPGQQSFQRPVGARRIIVASRHAKDTGEKKGQMGTDGRAVGVLIHVSDLSVPCVTCPMIAILSDISWHKNEIEFLSLRIKFLI